MPEAQLLTDEFGNTFYVSMDLSREYQKEGEGHSKTKGFMTLEEELRNAPNLAFSEEIAESVKNPPPKEEQEAIMQKFLKEATSSAESRKSFAKLLLVASAFGLSDLGSHGGNVGLIRTQKGDKHYCKFGIVDFQFHPQDETKKLSEGLLGYMKEHLVGSNRIPVVGKIFEALTPEDFVAAAKELESPKGRAHTKGGLLLTSSPLTRTTGEKIVEEIFKEVAEELRNKLPPKEYKAQIDELRAQKDVMIKNLTAVIAGVKKMDLKTSAETSPEKRPPEKPNSK